MTPAWLRRSAWLGFFLPPTAWAISLQTNYALVPVVCDGRVVIVSAVAAFLVLLALVGGVLALRVARTPLEAEWLDAAGGLPRQFVGWVGAGGGVIFALAIGNQFIASLIVNGCLQ
jgi:hypothetical protein